MLDTKDWIFIVYKCAAAVVFGSTRSRLLFHIGLAVMLISSRNTQLVIHLVRMRRVSSFSFHLSQHLSDVLVGFSAFLIYGSMEGHFDDQIALGFLLSCYCKEILMKPLKSVDISS